LQNIIAAFAFVSLMGTAAFAKDPPAAVKPGKEMKVIAFSDLSGSTQSRMIRGHLWSPSSAAT
jgi:hypothetical protein